MSNLVKGIAINNGRPVVIAKEGDLIHNLQPIAEVTPILIRNLKAGQPKTVVFNQKLKHNYQIIGVTADVSEDDNWNLNAGTNKQNDIKVTTEIRVFQSDKAVENLILDLSSYPIDLPNLFISYNDTWEIKVFRDVSKITFRCVPIIINDSISFI